MAIFDQENLMFDDKFHLKLRDDLNILFFKTIVDLQKKRPIFQLAA